MQSPSESLVVPTGQGADDEKEREREGEGGGGMSGERGWEGYPPPSTVSYRRSTRRRSDRTSRGTGHRRWRCADTARSSRDRPSATTNRHPADTRTCRPRLSHFPRDTRSPLRSEKRRVSEGVGNNTSATSLIGRTSGRDKPHWHVVQERSKKWLPTMALGAWVLLPVEMMHSRLSGSSELTRGKKVVGETRAMR